MSCIREFCIAIESYLPMFLHSVFSKIIWMINPSHNLVKARLRKIAPVIFSFPILLVVCAFDSHNEVLGLVICFFFFLNHLYPLVLYVFAVDTVHNEIAAGFSAILLMTE